MKKEIQIPELLSRRKDQRQCSGTTVYHGDSFEILKDIPEESIDLIITSPPYAERRKTTYGGISSEHYVKWFLKLSSLLFQKLKPSGTFILNIKEGVKDCEREVYVLELILEMRKQGYLWTEEFIWHKKNSVPGKWPNRFRDAWERCLQFNKNKKFSMYQDSVTVPIGNWKNKRLKNMSENDHSRHQSSTGSGFGRNISAWQGKQYVYPDNVLHLATVCNNQQHCAPFPKELPEFFIKLFTKEGDTVLDPFCGSGTVLAVSKSLKRKSIGIEIKKEYVDLIIENING